MRALHLLFQAGAGFRPRLRQSGQVQVETSAADFGAGAGAVAAVVVAALVAAEGLAGGEALEADGALVGLTGAGGGGGTHRREGLRGVVGRLPVAGLVASECLVGGEGLVADGALVGKLEGRGRRRAVVRGGGGGGAAAAASGEHDKAEGEVLFFRRWVVDPRAFGALPLRPCLYLVVRERRGSCGCGAHWGVQRFKGHFRERVKDGWFGLIG